MGFKQGVFLAIVATVFCVGFRSYPNGNNWPLDKSTAAGSKIFVIYPNGTRAIENDLPSGDPSAGSATITVDNLMTSIFNDYNNIQASFLVLAPQSDSDYAAHSTNRTITIEEANPNGPASGAEAKQTQSGGRITGCGIKIRAEAYNSAKKVVALLTHEIGHCLGLDHPQEITKSVMSYFNGDNITRLQGDDMMGITYLYPVTSSKAAESATLGMTCARK